MKALKLNLVECTILFIPTIRTVERISHPDEFLLRVDNSHTSYDMKRIRAVYALLLPVNSNQCFTGDNINEILMQGFIVS